MKTATALLSKMSPTWLRRLDRFFLLNFPMIWTIRIHYIVYFSIITTIVIAGIGMFFPLSMDNVGFLIGLPGILLITEIAVIILWVINIPNIGLGFYNYSAWTSYLDLACYTICILLIVLPSFSVYHTLEFNASRAVDVTQIDNESGEFADASRKILSVLTPSIDTRSYPSIGFCGLIARELESNNDYKRMIIRRYFKQPRRISFGDKTYAFYTEEREDLLRYCSSVNNVQSVRRFVTEDRSIERNGFYFVHALIVASGWLVLSFRYFRREIVLYFASLGVFFIIASFLSSYITTTFKLDYTIFGLVFSCGVMLFLIQRIISIKSTTKYSIMKAFYVTTLPISIAFSAVLISHIIEPNINGNLVLLVIIVLVYVFYTPYLKAKHDHLFELLKE